MAVNITLSNLMLLSGLVAMGSLASASPIDCAGPGVNQVTVPDVTALGANACSVIGSNLIFTDFAVSSTDSPAIPTPNIGIASPDDGTGVNGLDTNLVFQVTSGGSGLDDTFLNYQVTGGIVALDMDFTALPLASNGSVTITEAACSSAFIATVCSGTSYGTFSTTSICDGAFCTIASNAEFLTDGAENTVFVQDDIASNGANLTEFENSHFVVAGGAVPEPPMTSLTAVAFLLGLALFNRRRIFKP
jgi:hypothetical protein